MKELIYTNRGATTPKVDSPKARTGHPLQEAARRSDVAVGDSCNSVAIQRILGTEERDASRVSLGIIVRTDFA